MERLIRKCLHRPIATTVLFTAVVAAGGFAALNLPLEILPSVEFPRLYIQTAWPGASPPAVEADLTSLIEAEISTVKGIHKIRSESSAGFSSIEVELLPDADLDYLRFDVQEKLSFLLEKLPQQAQPPRIIPYVPEEIQTTRFMSYHIAGPYSDAHLRRLALRRIRPTLNGIPGVAGVEVIGGRERQIQIVFDDERLKTWEIFPADIQTALQQAHLIRSMGSLRAPRQKNLITLRQELTSLHDIETLPIKKAGQRLILLRDLARVADTLSPAYSLQRINGQPTILLQIEKEPRANSLAVANRVYGAVAALQPQLPQGVRLIKEDDQSIAIRENLRQLFYRALFSFLAIFLVLTLFLRYLRLTVMIQAGIIVSVCFTLLLMFIFRYSLNIITLAGLALGFGILVDNAIVVLENIYRYRTQSSPSPPAEIAVKATGEVAMPLLASTLTTMAALLPFLYFLGELKLYYTPFAITVSLALVASLLVAFFLIPTLAHHGFENWSPRPARAETTGAAAAAGWERIVLAYRKILKKALLHPRLTILLTIWIFGLPVWKLPNAIETPETAGRLKKTAIAVYNAAWDRPLVRQIRPYIDHLFGGTLHLFYRYVSRGELWRWGEATVVRAFISLPAGTAIEETDKIARDMELAVSGNPGIEQLRSRVYPNFAQLEVRFSPAAQAGLTPLLVKEQLIARAARTGNARVSVVGYGPGFSSGGGGMSFQNRLLLSGYNYYELNTFAETIKNRLEQFPRVREVRTDLTRRYYREDAFESAFILNRLDLSRYRFTAAGVLQQLHPYLSQYLYRQRLRLGWEEIPYSVVSHQYEGFQFYQLPQLRLRNPAQQEARLGALGRLAHRRVQPLIERENQTYYKVVAFDYLAPYRFSREFVEDFVKNTAAPAGFSLKPLEFRWEAKETQNVTRVLLLALLLMYMVLAGLYESFSYPLLIFLIIPLSLIGVFLAYYLTGAIFNQAAYIGVIFLMGIVVNNGIILLDRVNQLKRRGQFHSLPELLLTAGGERLRPILMTTLTTIAGLLPLLLLSDQNDPQDLWYTLSLSTIGGLAGAAVLGLLVLPVLVLSLEKIKIALRGFGVNPGNPA